MAACAAALVPAAAQAACRPPARIVSLSPTGTEMLFAIGAGKNVVAVDDQSNYPRTAPRTKLSGFTPNVEAILKYRPSVVVVAYNTNNVVGGLRAAKVRVISQPSAKNLGQSYRQIRALGAVTCRQKAAAKTVVRIRSGLAAAVKSAPRSARGKSYFHELDNTLYTATSRTFIGQIYRMFGLRNVADGADDGSGYPQMSAEGVIASNPSFIFLADGAFGESPATVAARPGWGGIAAVKNGDVRTVNADVASRWGPRVVVFARQVAAALRSS
ncbi:MAG: ABC transporter substrate-binding protein [Thermoleophilia bacterium]|nr:ABC transporter substrate-binding protein [Thermoleophilia bacterium]